MKATVAPTTTPKFSNIPQLINWAIALGASFSFSVATPIGKALITAGLDSDAILFARFWITLGLFVATVMLMKSEKRRIDRPDLPFVLFVGLANGVAMICIFSGLARLDASLVSMLLSVVPLIVLLLLALRGEPLTRRNLLRLGLAFVGLYLLIGPGGSPDLVGIALVLAAMFLFAMGLVTVQWKLQAYDVRVLSLYVTACITVLVTAWWFVQGQPWQPPGAMGWVGIVALSIVGTYMARILLYAAVHRIGSGQTSLLIPLEIVMSVVWSFLFLGERFSTIQAIGGVLIMGSALLAIRRLGQSPNRPRWRVWTRA